MNKHFLLSIVSAVAALCCDAANAQSWKKHTIMEQGHFNTAVALDANGDKHLDVIASFNGRVSLFIAPNWKTEIILYRFPTGGGCIHSSVIDGDGDLEYIVYVELEAHCV